MPLMKSQAREEHGELENERGTQQSTPPKRKAIDETSSAGRILKGDANGGAI